MKPNTKFELNVADLELIESALHHQLAVAKGEEQRSIHNLLGKLHNQKTWYRPKKETYVGG
jgi:hypothetical protein